MTKEYFMRNINQDGCSSKVIDTLELAFQLHESKLFNLSLITIREICRQRLTHREASNLPLHNRKHKKTKEMSTISNMLHHTK